MLINILVWLPALHEQRVWITTAKPTMLHHLKACKHVLQDVRYRAMEESCKKGPGSDEEGEFDLIPIAGPSSGPGFIHGPAPPFHGMTHTSIVPPVGLQRSFSLPAAGSHRRFHAVSADGTLGESYWLYMHINHTERLLSRLNRLSHPYWTTATSECSTYTLRITIPQPNSHFVLPQPNLCLSSQTIIRTQK